MEQSKIYSSHDVIQLILNIFKEIGSEDYNHLSTAPIYCENLNELLQAVKDHLTSDIREYQWRNCLERELKIILRDNSKNDTEKIKAIKKINHTNLSDLSPFRDGVNN